MGGQYRNGSKKIGINAINWAVSVQDRDYWIGLENAALNLQVL
jgi:hypothetical protein